MGGAYVADPHVQVEGPGLFELLDDGSIRRPGLRCLAQVGLLELVEHLTDRETLYLPVHLPQCNRTEVNDTINGNASYSANNLNQYTSVGSASFDYDDNGNLTSGNGTFVYDAQNRLTSASVAVTNETLGYDSKNRVVQRSIGGTTTYLIYDGWDLIEERNGSNAVLATYVHGAKEDELLTRTDASGNTVYYHHNALGSVTDLTNASGDVVEKYKYDAFGTPTITTASGGALTLSAYGNRFMFTGREYLAELGLYDYRNRVYSPSLGRFLQTDSLKFSGQDINIYRYCGNDPLNFTDGMGTCAGANTPPPPPTPGPTPPNPSWWSSFWQGFSDPNAWQQSAAATVDGLETLGGLLGNGSFSIDPGNQYNQNISMDLGGVGDLGVAGAAASFLGLGGAAADASAGNEAFWFGSGAQDAAEAAGANTLQLSSEATDALAAGDPSLMQAESAAFAANASGDVSVYAGAAADDFTAGNTFWNSELPQLLNNPNVTSISYIFPK